MDQAIVDDFKQFVAATVVQATSELRQDITGLSGRVDDLSGRVDHLSGRVDGLSEGMDTMDLKLDTILNAVGEQFEDHEHRITRLETKTI